jgi:hypothetical protein
VSFYSIDSFLFSDILRNFGCLSSNIQNPYHDWSAVFIPYSTGDFHCGNGDFFFEDVHGSQKVLPCHGLTNVREAIKIAMEYLSDSPETVMVTGCSAGGFGTSIISDDIFRSFPEAKSYISYNDSGFLVFPRWHDVATNVWKTPKKITDHFVSTNISLDCMKALKRDYGDKVKILFSCSNRDSELSKYLRYIRSGELKAEKEDGEIFQSHLKAMVKEMQEEIPDSAIFIFDTLDEEHKEAELTVHCISASNAIYTTKADGKSYLNWLVNAVEGSAEKLGLALLG